MSLQDKLNIMRAQFEESAPKDALSVMHRVTDELKKSKIMDRVLKQGDLAPTFLLTDHTRQEVSSAALLKKGPLVVSFYRGVW